MTENLGTIAGSSPSIDEPPTILCRRTAIAGAMALAVAPVAALPALASTIVLDQGDARLGVIATLMIAAQAALVAHYGDDDEFTAILKQFDDLTLEMETTPATSLAGVLQKLRVIKLPDVGMNQNAHDVMVSICEDVARLHAAGVLHG